jgi:hypothetical protein
MTLTENYTFQFGDDGIVLNTVADANSPFVDVETINGLDNVDPRATVREREGMDGGFIDAEFESSRLIILTGTIYSPSDQLETFLDTLKANYEVSTTSKPFYFVSTGGQRLVYCKCISGLRYTWTHLLSIGKVTFQIQLQAEDPAIYESASTVSTELGGSVTGRSYNKSYDFGYGGTSSYSGTLSVYNAGNKDTDATLTITGGVTSPVIVNDSTGYKLDFIGFTVDSTDELSINLRNRTIVLNGSTNRRNALRSSSRWFMLPPGSTTLRFLGTITSGTPTLSVTFRSAYR